MSETHYCPRCKAALTWTYHDDGSPTCSKLYFCIKCNDYFTPAELRYFTDLKLTLAQMDPAARQGLGAVLRIFWQV